MFFCAGLLFLYIRLKVSVQIGYPVRDFLTRSSHLEAFTTDRYYHG